MIRIEGEARAAFRTASSIRSCSPMQRTSRSVGGNPEEHCAAKARSTSGGRKVRVISLRRRKRSMHSGSARISNGIGQRVPPAAQVEKISWKATSKPRGANWPVRATISSSQRSHSAATRFTNDACDPRTALGSPVDPLVKSTKHGSSGRVSIASMAGNSLDGAVAPSNSARSITGTSPRERRTSGSTAPTRMAIAGSTASNICFTRTDGRSGVTGIGPLRASVTPSIAFA